jgi:hypothetical protein
MKIGDATVHGFRSSFRDWSAECTKFTNEVCEAALAHVIENKAEAAYRRGDLFEKRRNLMNAWADYCAGGKEGKSRRVQTTSKLILVAANHLERKGPPQLVGDDNCACSSSPLLTSFISCATLHIYIYIRTVSMKRWWRSTGFAVNRFTLEEAAQGRNAMKANGNISELAKQGQTGRCHLKIT